MENRGYVQTSQLIIYLKNKSNMITGSTIVYTYDVMTCKSQESHRNACSEPSSNV